MAPDVDAEEVFRLARAMTLKNAAAGLPQGGGKSGSVAGYTDARQLPREDLLTVPCDILLPAARPDSIHEGNVERVEARLILQGANIPATQAAESALHARGVVCVPDFIANAGGVICASVEYRGGSEAAALEKIADEIRRNTALVLERSRAAGEPPRVAAVRLARERVREAVGYRR